MNKFSPFINTMIRVNKKNFGTVNFLLKLPSLFRVDSSRVLTPMRILSGRSHTSVRSFLLRNTSGKPLNVVFYIRFLVSLVFYSLTIVVK